MRPVVKAEKVKEGYIKSFTFFHDGDPQGCLHYNNNNNNKQLNF